MFSLSMISSMISSKISFNKNLPLKLSRDSENAKKNHLPAANQSRCLICPNVREIAYFRHKKPYRKPISMD